MKNRVIRDGDIPPNNHRSAVLPYLCALVWIGFYLGLVVGWFLWHSS